MFSTKNTFTAFLFSVLLPLAFPLFADENSGSDTQWLAEANARIEKHRKEDIQFYVSQAGKPVANANVEVKMLRHEFLFGCNFFMFDRYKTEQLNEEYAKQFSELLNFATLGFYWASYEREEGKPNDEYTKKVAQWCKEHNIRTKGHPLVWNTSDPAWIKEMPSEELFKRQMQRAAVCAERFKGLIDTWDVINEVVEWEGNRKGSPLLTELGLKIGKPEFTKASFEAVRKANPKATLLINDYVTDKRYAAFIDELQENGKAIYDVIGIQSHMHGGVWNNKTIWDTCERFKRFGVPLHFTELTVVSTSGVKRSWNQDWSKSQTDENGEKEQRDDVVRIYTMLFSHPLVEAVTWWDFSDHSSWMEAPAGLVRRDMSPKPSYLALKKLIKEDWATNTTLKTQADGKAPLRAFRGDYRFTVTLPDGTVKEFSDSVQKGGGRIELTF
jgi:GH35 family endo-1,4-beta-xylanase